MDVSFQLAFIAGVERTRPASSFSPGTGGLSSTIIVVVIVGFIALRQLSLRPLTRQDVLVPVIGGLVLAYSYMQHADALSTVLVMTGALFGIAIGLASGQLLKVWRDPRTGMIHQRGNWLSVLVTLALVALRFLLSFALHKSGITASTPALNDALTAMALGSYVGQALNVGLRVLALNGWDFQVLQTLPDKGALKTSRERPLPPEHFS